MIFSACSRENEVAELLARGHWPQACAPELRSHIEACPACSDLILVTRAFQSARAEAVSTAKGGSGGALWWRAQLRRRNAAVERAGRPILGAQVFALAVNLLLVAGFLVYQARHGFNWLSWLEQLPQSQPIHFEVLWPSALFTSGWSFTLLIPVLATLALVGGVAVYLVSENQ
jgi:hypothetical protein